MPKIELRWQTEAEANHTGCHYACNEVMQRDGGNARCCRCVGHGCLREANDAE